MRFAKYHGTGNDFVMVEDLDDALRLEPAVIRALCDRHRGVGADGLIRIAPADEADFFMDYSNADGEVAEMCGNGIRCLAKYVYDRGLTTATQIDVLTRAGVKHLVLEVDGAVVRDVTVDMGPPALERKAIPMIGDPMERFVGQPMEVDGMRFTATAVSMGNPHCVLFLGPGDDLASLDVRRLGAMVERGPEFPPMWSSCGCGPGRSSCGCGSVGRARRWRVALAPAQRWWLAPWPARPDGRPRWSSRADRSSWSGGTGDTSS